MAGALKITVERVDLGAKANGSMPIRSESDQLPIQIIVPDSDTTGISAATLKKFLSLALEAELGTALVDIATLDDLAGCITVAYVQTA